MVPLVILALVAVVLVVTVLGVVSGKVRVDPLSDAVHSTPETGLPPAPVAADVDTVRFDTALRGYRMDDVDARLDDLRGTLADREQTLAELGGWLPHPAPARPARPEPQPPAAPAPLSPPSPPEA